MPTAEIIDQSAQLAYLPLITKVTISRKRMADDMQKTGINGINVVYGAQLMKYRKIKYGNTQNKINKFFLNAAKIRAAKNKIDSQSENLNL